jgi:hypothetical protein
MTATAARPDEIQDIDGVLAALRTVVDDAASAGDRIGLFAAVYRQVTATIGKGVADGLFDDADRLNRFDVVFAGRYLTALQTWRDGRDPGRSWRLAFRAAAETDLVLVQHVVLGINAHINLDLAVAAAEIAPGDQITGLKDDFERINDVLLDVLCDLQGALNELSPLLGGLDVVLGRLDEEIFGFKLQRARSEAWEAAVLLAGQAPEARDQTVRMLDRYAHGVGRFVLVQQLAEAAPARHVGYRLGRLELLAGRGRRAEEIDGLLVAELPDRAVAVGLRAADQPVDVEHRVRADLPELVALPQCVQLGERGGSGTEVVLGAVVPEVVTAGQGRRTELLQRGGGIPAVLDDVVPAGLAHSASSWVDRRRGPSHSTAGWDSTRPGLPAGNPVGPPGCGSERLPPIARREEMAPWPGN